MAILNKNELLTEPSSQNLSDPANQTPTDEELAGKVQKGDVEAFDVLLTRYHTKILRYGYKFLLQTTDIEDVTQEIFLKAYKYIKSFNTSLKFSPWIYRIAHNEFINHGKKRKSELIDFFDFDTILPHLSSKVTAEKETDDGQIKEMLDRCLDKLSAKYREPLVLYFLEGLDYKDIAEILRIPVATVGVRLNRGKKQLAKAAEQFKDSL